MSALQRLVHGSVGILSKKEFTLSSNMKSKDDAHLKGYSTGLNNYRDQPQQHNPYVPNTQEYADFQRGFEDGKMDSHTHWNESAGKDSNLPENTSARITYKFWQDMTPTEKTSSTNYGRGRTVWNPQTRMYAVKYPVPADTGAQSPLVEQELGVTAEQLEQGDPVVITGNVNFSGATGYISSHGRDKKFVVVDLHNHGPHSFNSSDVTFNEYTDRGEEENSLRDHGLYEDIKVLTTEEAWAAKLRRYLK
jgi:hypothetical protein